MKNKIQTQIVKNIVCLLYKVCKIDTVYWNVNLEGAINNALFTFSFKTLHVNKI